MEIHTAITLLTVTVILLSAAMLVILGLVIAILVKVRKLTQSMQNVLQNVAQASEWLAPAKVISQIINAFRK